MTYGDLPEDLGLVDISPVEMMFWMYCPIKTPTSGFVFPANLDQFAEIVSTAWDRDANTMRDRYVYLTAKTLWVSGDYIGNRPGWHSDGFGTDDVNYIWSDRAPTEFFADEFELPDKCEDAMTQMEARATGKPLVTYPDKHLLRLTPSVIHRSPVGFSSGVRTFVKVSVSRDRYNLEGNSINHKLSERWEMLPRSEERNHPAKHA